MTLVEIARPLFLLGGGLKERTGAEELRGELLRGMAAFDDAARKAGFSAAAVEEARYALCAWLDEMVFYTSPISIEWLSHSLTVQQFQDQAAGSNFFERLQRLHQKADMQQALEVYAACVLLGFKGRYRLEPAEQLGAVVEEILEKKEKGWKELPWFPAMKADPGRRPKERTGRRLVWGAVAMTVFAVLFYAMLAFLAQALS